MKAMFKRFLKRLFRYEQEKVEMYYELMEVRVRQLENKIVAIAYYLQELEAKSSRKATRKTRSNSRVPQQKT